MAKKKRNGMDFAECEKYIPMIFQTKLRPCFMGHTGIGKTEFWKQFAKKFGLDLIIIHVAQLEPSDFVGLYKINEDDRTSNCAPSWLPHKTLSPEEAKVFIIGGKDSNGMTLADLKHKGFINPKGGIVFLDEVNRAPEDMRQSLYQFLQDGQIHTYSLPDGDGSGEKNELGLPMGKYHIACAANPTGEGYETYEFDPALNNRLAFVNFTPQWDDTRSYLKGKYGSNPVLSFIDSHEEIVNYGDEFEIKDTLYSPRMTENHIILYNASKKEGKEFRRKVFETIMPKEVATDFMAYLEEIEFVNYVDILNGVTGDKKARLEKVFKEKRMDVTSTITMDLADYWANHQIGKTKSELFKDEKKAIEFTVDFLNMCEDDQICAFMDGLNKSYDSKTSFIKTEPVTKILKPRMAKNRHIFEAIAAG